MKEAFLEVIKSIRELGKQVLIELFLLFKSWRA